MIFDERFWRTDANGLREGEDDVTAFPMA